MSGSSQMPELRFVDVPGPVANSGQQRRLAYWDWMPQQGADAHRVVVCVHGLSRQGRDFDVLASALTAQARVIAVQERAREVRRRFMGTGTPYTPHAVDFYGN